MARRVLLVAACVLASFCGGGGGGTGPTPTPPPSNPYTFTITSAGVSPTEFTVPAGTRVLFVNNDSRRHDIGSDPHPDHSDCPSEFQSVGILQPSQSKETGNFNTVRTCGFHDHDLPTNDSLKGRVIVR